MGNVSFYTSVISKFTHFTYLCPLSKVLYHKILRTSETNKLSDVIINSKPVVVLNYLIELTT